MKRCVNVTTAVVLAIGCSSRTDDIAGRPSDITAATKADSANNHSTRMAKTVASADPVAQNSPDSVPLHLVKAVPARLELLRPGMSPGEVWQTLRLAEFQSRLRAIGGGPFQDFWTSYSLHPTESYNLILVFDVRDKNGRLDPKGGVFKRARLAGLGWDAAQ